MQSALDKSEKQIALLKTLELEDVCETIDEIVTSEFKPSAVGILLWDQDFESFSDSYKFAFGAASEEMMDLIDSIILAGTVDGAECPSQVQPLRFHKVTDRDRTIGIVLVGGDSTLSERDLESTLNQFPLQYALANCYEVAELRRESERVREQYEILEADYQEEKRLNSQSGIKHTNFKIEQTDKERLIYEISNAVRSSLDPEQVLDTTVTKIGMAYQLSRCLVMRQMPEGDDYRVYEYHDDSVTSGRDLFFTDEGKAFVQLATSKTAPHDFMDGADADNEFDSNFIRQFELAWGMMVPLMYGERNIGSLFLQDCKMLREWSIDNTAYLGSLADFLSMHIENANMHEEKARQAVTDGLTGISNRRFFNETFAKEFERAKRYGTSLSLAIFDLDFLKKINDTFGHHVGDEAIKSIGALVGKSCRAVDLAARFGGEEFCLLLPETNHEDAMRLAERVRKLINETDIEGPGLISASVGVATFPNHANEQDELFEAADKALYVAKQSGRNRVCAAVQAEH
jgi:diguanylate cyclase (GGDEF)-like protein